MNDNWHPQIIKLPGNCLDTLTGHCRRKLEGEYLPGEDRDLKAFGLLAGQRQDDSAIVARCFPLLHNARQSAAYRDFMDRMMTEHAIPSVTPFAERGWVADPEELTGILRGCREHGLVLLGSYHMHRIPWPQDPIRDTPTTLDTILGDKSRLLMFIVSMVDPSKPTIRAFAEGDVSREVPIHYI